MHSLEPPVAHLLPYCGQAPIPAVLWRRWNLDPILIAALIALLAAYLIGARRSETDFQKPTDRQCIYFSCGWTLTTLALISPLCPLSVALFSARVGQHMLLTLIAAPLIAAGRPLQAYSVLLRIRWNKRISSRPIWLIAALDFAALLWFWHAPYPYSETFASTTVYWLMHISLFGASLWLWTALLSNKPSSLVGSILASIISSVQMGLLGAIIMFAPRPLYSPHALTTLSWGLTPLEDQQLGAVIMWAPGCTIFLAVTVLGLWHLLERAQWVGRPESISPLRSNSG